MAEPQTASQGSSLRRLVPRIFSRAPRVNDLDNLIRRNEIFLARTVGVGVLSAEAPAELAEESDVTVEGLDGWLAILEWLAEPGESTV